MPNVTSYDSMPEMKDDFGSLTDGQLVQTAGYYSPNDGGGALYQWVEDANGEPPNDGTVVAPFNILNDPPFDAGRFFLIHNGFVDVRQFGAIGNGTATPVEDQVGGLRFPSIEYLNALYSATAGNPFNLIDATVDTVDWAAIQAAILWCLKSGVRLHVSSGIYMVNRPLWIGRDDTVAYAEVGVDEFEFSQGVKDAEETGFFLEGLVGLSRRETDNESANIRLTEPVTLRYVVSVGLDMDEFTIAAKFGDEGTTPTLDGTTTVEDLVDELQEAIGDGFVLGSPDEPTDLIVGRTTVVTIERVGPAPNLEAYPGDLVATPNDTTLASAPSAGYFAWAFPDNAIVSFRRSAGVHYVVQNLTLRGNSGQGEEAEFRGATFGIAHVNCAFTEHQVSRCFVSYVDTAYAILSGGAGNGELTQFDRLFTADTFRAFFCNNPQSFLLNFTDWYVGLDTDGLFVDLQDAQSPGQGLNLFNCHATFGPGGNDDGKGTLVRVRRGTGIVQWTGGRIEHMACLFDYDALDGQGPNDSLDLVLRGVEFDGTFNQAAANPSRPLVSGSGTEGSATQYGLVVDACRFASSQAGGVTAAQTDLLLKATAPGLRCSFVRTRFDGFRSIRTEGLDAEFDRCYRSDFSTPGATSNRLREFTEVTGTPGPRFQSQRTVFQDTPFAQAGPRTNILRNASFTSQSAESSSATSGAAFNTSSSWSLLNFGGSTETNLAGFARWGKGYDDANVDMGPQSFYLALSGTDRLETNLDAFDLDDADTTKVATYQCLCRVKGKMRFALVKSDDADVVFDEVVIDSQSAYSDLTLVTLRGQYRADGGATYFKVRIENLLSSAAQWQVTTQQAWGGTENTGDWPNYPLELGLANQTFVPTADNAKSRNRYQWSVNALGVMALSRLRIPAKPQKYGWEQRSLIGGTVADLFDGDVYYDTDQVAVLMVMNENQMFCVHQPERISAAITSNFDWDPGDPKNLLVSGNSSAIDINLNFDTSAVPDGTIVRVYRNTAFTNGVTVKAGSGGGAMAASIDAGKMGEFVFVGGKWRSVVLNVAFAAQA